MGFLTKFLFFVITAFIVFIGIQINNLLSIPPVPKLEETWWGPGQPKKEDTSIKPFKISVPQEVLKDLKQRLETARPFVEPLEGIQQQYGMNTKLLKNIVEFWKTKYNWNEREAFLNQYPQYTTNIQGLKIHYLHVKPAEASKYRVIPLLLLHGWPGSVREFYEIIPLLTTPRKGFDFVFEVIIPSLPGYGFSQAASKPGLGAAQMAVVFKNLMRRLGYEKFYVQGGDWGSAIGTNMAILFPNNVAGLHSNMCFNNAVTSSIKLFLGSFYPSWIVDKEHEDKVYPLSKIYSHVLLESGYMHIQATKPDTVGVGLNDSPVGLAAYLIEKFITWTNRDWNNKEDGGLLTAKFSYASLLDNVMIYWVTGSITTSMRMYAETLNKEQTALQLDYIPVDVPTACLKFANELLYQPDSLLTDHYRNLLQSTDFANGGHFAAFEEPKVVANDVWSAVDKFLEHVVKPKQ